MRDEQQFQGIVGRAREGDAAAWGVLYDTVAPVLLAYLRAQSLRDPEDVAGEVLLQVVRDLERFVEGGERAFRSWVLTIARHRMLDARRARQRRPADPVPHDDLDTLVTPDHQVDDVLAADAWQELAPYLEALTDDQRDVVLLRVLGELSLEETADVMDRTVGAVKALQHRAFGALRTQMRDVRNSDGLPSASQV